VEKKTFYIAVSLIHHTPHAQAICFFGINILKITTVVVDTETMRI
jgi:hypothetical protein